MTRLPQYCPCPTLPSLLLTFPQHHPLLSLNRTEILSILNAINAKVTALDGRVQHTECALADRTTNLVDPSTATSDSHSANASNVATPTALSVSTTVIPTTEYLRNNLDIQKQVDARFVELHNAQILFIVQVN